MNRITAVFLIVLFPLFFGCFNSSAGNEDDNPKTMNRIIPPDFTLSIDFSPVQQAEKSYSAEQKCEQESEYNGEEYLCIGMAVSLVTWSNSICFLPFSIPIAIYKTLKDQTPDVATADYVEWNYSYTYCNVEYNVYVTAEYNTEEQEWDWAFKINDFIWITGSSKEDLTSGSWQYYDYFTGAATIGVEWERTSEINGRVTFINNNQSQELKYGDYIMYARTDDLVTVRFHDVHSGLDDSGDLLDIEVYWYIEGRTGGINNINGNEICSWDLND